MKMRRITLGLFLLAGYIVTAPLLAFDQRPDAKQLKPVTIFLEGDSSTVPKLINILRQKGPEYGLDFKFVDKKDDAYDYRLILSSEGSGTWNYAHGNVVVLNQEGKLIFTVTRSGRLTAKGAASALAKEFVKLIARYAGTHS